MFKLSALLVVTALAAVNAATLPRLDGRIVGGALTTIEKYPYQIGLLSRGSAICGGTLIGSKWVVTAAHCTDGASASSLSIRAGSTFRASGGQTILVKKINQHPQYNSDTIDYDISVLELASAVTVANAKPIGLVSSGSSVSTGATATITGWGTTSEGGSVSSQLRVVQVPTVSQASCKSAYGSSSITARMFCAGAVNGGKDACQGDSGGPVVINGVLTGVVSWGYGCARPGYPGVYSNVAVLRSYVKQISGI